MRRYRAAVGVTGAFFAIMVAASFYWAGAGTVTGEAETLLVFFATILFGATVHAYQSDQASRMVDFGATAALALSVTHGVPGLVIDPGMGWILAVTIVGLVGGGLLCRWSSGFAVTQVIARALPRIVTVAILAVLLHSTHPAGVYIHVLQREGPQGFASALVAILYAALLVEAPMRAELTERGSDSRLAIHRRELRESVTLGLVPATTAVLIAVAMPILGLPALPLLLLPLVFNQAAIRRREALRRDSRRSVLALSAMPEAKGLVRRGHAARVAELATEMGRSMGLSRRELKRLERAALLHDLGQVRIARPLPSGATVLAAPADQENIAAGGAAIARATGVLEDEAAIIESQALPYHQYVARSVPVPPASQVIKVANAYDDLLTGRAPGLPLSDTDAALERIYLGLGHEYDPAAVDALAGLVRAGVSDVTGRSPESATS